MALEPRTVALEEDTSERDAMTRRLRARFVMALPVFILAMVADPAPAWLPDVLSMRTV